MSNSHDVMSDLLDNRPFDLADLAAALEAPDGRALLIDLLALRRAVQPTDSVPKLSLTPAPSRTWLRSALVAAALFAAVIGGYTVGTHRTPPVVAEAPDATRVVQVVSTGQVLIDGGRR